MEMEEEDEEKEKKGTCTNTWLSVFFLSFVSTSYFYPIYILVSPYTFLSPMKLQSITKKTLIKAEGPCSHIHFIGSIWELP